MGALVYVAAAIVYAVAWDFRRVCFGRDGGPPCPPLPVEPAQWLTAARWAAWSAGALLVLAALVFAGP